MSWFYSHAHHYAGGPAFYKVLFLPFFTGNFDTFAGQICPDEEFCKGEIFGKIVYCRLFYRHSFSRFSSAPRRAGMGRFKQKETKATKPGILRFLCSPLFYSMPPLSRRSVTWVPRLFTYTNPTSSISTRSRPSESHIEATEESPAPKQPQSTSNPRANA